MSLPNLLVPYLQGRFERADLVLFSGAGLSHAARNQAGQLVPLGDALGRMLWQLCYPGTPVDDAASLADLYGNALRHQRGRLEILMREQFTVDRGGVPDLHRLIFSLPWRTVYTLNVDDLDQAVQQRYDLPRPIVSISATTGATRGDAANPEALRVIHLNGCLSDGVDKVTFSTPQYAKRLSALDPFLAQAAVDILSAPMVFVGTEVDESPLWQHVELRGRAEAKDLRRRSFLVLPSLSRPRQDALEQEFHVEWIPLRIEEFADQVLSGTVEAARKGLELIRSRPRRSETLQAIPLAAELSAKEREAVASQYLYGATPTWGDIRSGRAAVREIDGELRAMISGSLQEKGPRPLIIVTGTAGSGKSTACMRAALATSATGVNIGWVDAEIDAAPSELRRLMDADDHPPVLMIDDADRYGNDVAILARDLARSRGDPLIILSIRSGRVERVADRLRLIGAPHHEVVMPNLTDRDIDALLDVLTNENRLGELRKLTRAGQVNEFRKRADRQLLVAMIEATSNRNFDEKIVEELNQLAGAHRYVYAIVAIVTALRVGLNRSEILLTLEAPSNESLRVIDDLTRRLLISERPNGEYRVRHRVVAEHIVDALAAEHSMREPVSGICRACAVPLTPTVKRGSADYRRMRTVMNHDWLRNLLGKDGARQVLGELEGYVSWDHHYWLQRGSLELECDELDRAENSLTQAAGMEPNDQLVLTELGYLRLKQAVNNPNGETSRQQLEEGQQLLRGVIFSRARFDPHQYNIFGHQSLLWTQRADATPQEQEQVLTDAMKIVEEGRRNHPRDERLRELFVMIQNERLGHGWAAGAESPAPQAARRGNRPRSN